MIVAIVLAFAFAATNGLHDASNAVATLVATRAARPKYALALAAVFNLLGPVLVGAAVARAIGGIVAIGSAEAIDAIAAGLLGAVAWNLLTWRWGLPSSSGHALVGGLVGAAVVAGGARAVHWAAWPGRAPREPALARPRPAAQWATSATLAFSHGANDAQKSRVIAAVLLADGRIDALAAPLWATVGCAAALTLGTAAGGWSIMRTVGRRIYHLHPVDGLCSQGASAAVILGASLLGAPTSTTQVVASSVVGVGGGRRRWHHVRWSVVRQMGLAWVLTMPASAMIAAVALLAWRWAT